MIKFLLSDTFCAQLLPNFTALSGMLIQLKFSGNFFFSRLLFYLLTCVAVEVLMEEMGFFEKHSDHTLELARFLFKAKRKGKSGQILVCLPSLWVRIYSIKD